MTVTPETAAAPDHEILPRPGTAYSMAGMNTNLQAVLTNALHYPVEAICVCGEMIRCERLICGPWRHLGRMPGEPAVQATGRRS